MVDGKNGLLSTALLDGKVRPKDMHSPQTRLVVLENTHNRGGGTCYELDDVKAISSWAKANGLAMHLDGARLWNASVATGVSLRDWVKPFDSVSVCFSKGLGAPVGSCLAGPKDFIDQGRWVRKLFGGAMRQAGYLTAACLYAMDHHVERLAEDHANAKLLGDAVRTVPQLKLVPENVETNLVWFEVDPAWKAAPAFVAELREKGILASALGRIVVRMCTHLNVTKAECERAAAAIRAFAK